VYQTAPDGVYFDFDRTVCFSLPTRFLQPQASFYVARRPNGRAEFAGLEVLTILPSLSALTVPQVPK
jgi:hypothetical protein